MTGEYEVSTSDMLWDDVDVIKEDIMVYSNKNDAENWEDGLYESIRSLKTVAAYQVCELESQVVGLPIRKLLYRQKDVKRQYHLFFTIEEYPRPTIEPSTPYLLGVVKIFTIRHASRQPMTGRELRDRLKLI
jgi:hypothetical protein